MEIKYIVIHCSDSSWGDAEIIDEWHEARGFNRRHAFAHDKPLKHIGYHYVIQNGRREPLSDYCARTDGLVETGRLEGETGAHAYGVNSCSLGICLIGKNFFTARQLDAVEQLLREIFQRHCLGPAVVIGHGETKFERRQARPKTCPNFDLQAWKSRIDW